jgi:hypothetical protein
MKNTKVTGANGDHVWAFHGTVWLTYLMSSKLRVFTSEAAQETMQKKNADGDAWLGPAYPRSPPRLDQ